MPIEEKTLDTNARAYAATMTSIRGRRVHRFLMREFERFEYVLVVTAEDGLQRDLARMAVSRCAEPMVEVLRKK